MKLTKTEIIGGKALIHLEAQTKEDQEFMDAIGNGLIHGSCGWCVYEETENVKHKHVYTLGIKKCKPIEGYWSGGAPCPVCGDIGNEKSEHTWHNENPDVKNCELETCPCNLEACEKVEIFHGPSGNASIEYLCRTHFDELDEAYLYGSTDEDGILFGKQIDDYSIIENDSPVYDCTYCMKLKELNKSIASAAKKTKKKPKKKHCLCDMEKIFKVTWISSGDVQVTQYLCDSHLDELDEAFVQCTNFHGCYVKGYNIEVSEDKSIQKHTCDFCNIDN